MSGEILEGKAIPLVRQPFQVLHFVKRIDLFNPLLVDQFFDCNHQSSQFNTPVSK